jgi:hypothetical protein
MFNLFKKKPTPKRRAVLVHLADGTTSLHKTAYRTIRNNGAMCLHNEKGGGLVVADYAAGSWVSMVVVEEQDEE